MDANGSIQFAFIRGSFLIVCDYGYAALWSSVQVPIVTSPLRGRDRDENQYTEGHEDHRGGESPTTRRAIHRRKRSEGFEQNLAKETKVGPPNLMVQRPTNARPTRSCVLPCSEYERVETRLGLRRHPRERLSGKNPFVPFVSFCSNSLCCLLCHRTS